MNLDQLRDRPLAERVASLERSIATYDAVGYTRLAGHTAGNLGGALQLAGRLDDAAHQYRVALDQLLASEDLDAIARPCREPRARATGARLLTADVLATVSPLHPTWAEEALAMAPEADAEVAWLVAWARCPAP